ncbi:DUF4926 domain-containing protein [Methylomicrobium lacus]|uniref:DUF4926 domain-containing protein n=1 Tax=Methylomicrobium lacus TaxID=136992 RepID=UPI0035A8FE68
MTLKLLDTVVLVKELPNSGLQPGDIGAVVALYEPDGVEVEFVSATGKTQALVTLKIADVRSINYHDMLAVRPLNAA